MRFSTRTIHAGQKPHGPYRTVMPPIYQSATFEWEKLDEIPEFDYTRAGNPTRAALEQVYVALENGKQAVAQATGMAAIATACSWLKPGDRIVSQRDIYGGTFRYFEIFLKALGIGIDYFDTADTSSLEAAMTPQAKLVWLETPTNPILRICDLHKCAEIARAHGARSAVDNTFASPYYQRPLELGCDIVMHSTTKYINGHSDVVGGALIWSDDALTEPLTMYAKAAGNTPSPFDCWLTLRGSKTLAVRMRQHAENAQAIAEFLEGHPKVERVHYPGLKSHPQHELAKSQMSGFGGMLSFEVRGGAKEAKTVCEGTEIFLLAESLGGVESLIGWPPVMSHAYMSEEERAARDIPPSLVRVSVGIEDKEDLIADLDQALDKMP